MLDQVNDIINNILNDGEFLQNTAKVLKKFHNELVLIGFTEE